jgi:hypothetical protein
MNKLIIGTAQFGLNYGINNFNNKLQLPEMKLILSHAKNNDIDFIDTAISYGNSEENLGKIGVKDFKIISKLPKLPNKVVNVKSWVMEQTKASIKKLNIKKLYGLLLHNPSDLFGPNGENIIKALKELKLSGLVLKIGVSIYDPKELNDIFSLLKLDIVQSPLNIVDRRLVNSGWLSRLNDKGVEVHVRSIFLQGLLLIHRDRIPLKFERWSKIWDKWYLKLNNNKLNAVLVCLRYLETLKGVDRIIIGVDNINHMKEIISLKNIEISKSDWSFMESCDQNLINPSNWNKL